MPTRLTVQVRAVALVVAVVAAVAAGDSPAAVPGIPSIHVTYSANCTFTMTVDPGITITASTGSGPTLPPGQYELSVFMPNPAEGYAPCERPSFSFTGPGVRAVTQFRGEELVDEHLLPPLQPSSTYVAEDGSAPAQTRRVFTTAASGSSTGLLSPSTGGGSGPSKTSVQTDLVGSAVLAYRGKLVATVGVGGKATLKRAGRSVGSLKAGRYDVTVDDAAARAGFFVQRGSRKPVTVSSLPFVGTRTKRLALTAGRWTFFSQVGRPTSFTVVA
jgi:hypothetical protein